MTVGGLFDTEWRLAVACREGQIYTVKVTTRAYHVARMKSNLQRKTFAAILLLQHCTHVLGAKVLGINVGKIAVVKGMLRGKILGISVGKVLQ